MSQQICSQHEPEISPNGIEFCRVCGVILNEPQPAPRIERAEIPGQAPPAWVAQERQPYQQPYQPPPFPDLETRIRVLESQLHKVEPPKPKLQYPPWIKYIIYVVVAWIAIQILQVSMCGYSLGG